jgi:capsular exopolysaccharide synthesis family protein
MQDRITPSWTHASSTTLEPEGSSPMALALRSLRRRWVLFGSVLVLALAGGIAALVLVKPVYRAQAILEVRPEMPLLSWDVPESTITASLQMWGTYYRSQEAILRSRSLVQAALKALPPETLKALRLGPDPEKSFLERLEVERTDSSFILKVAFLDPDARAAAEAVNTLVSVYLEDANRRLRDHKNEVLDALTKQTVPAIQQRLLEAEKDLQGFQTRTGFVDFEEKYASLIESRRRIGVRLSEVRLRRLHLASDVKALGAGSSQGPAEVYSESFQGNRTLEPLATQKSALAADLAREEQTLKEKHPRILELKKQLASVEDRIREAVRGALGSMEANLRSTELEEKSLEAESARVEREMSESRRDLGEYKRLDSALASARELYSAYVRKQSESGATSASGLASVRIVDRATVASEPHKRPVFLFTLALAVGLPLAFGAVWLAEQVDDRIVSTSDLRRSVGLEVLGEIPEFKGEEPANGEPRLLAANPDSAELEPFRCLRDRILAAFEEKEGHKVLLVTSPEPGDGKSTVAINLARALALDGRRVLLFDAELRHPRLKALLGDSRRPGLEELLRGEASLQQAVQRSRIPGIDLIGADQGLIGAPEQAASLRFRAALQTARERYDAVVIDTTPVNLVSETAYIARRADATLLVVREGRTRRGAAAESVKKLHGMKAGVLGVVFRGGSPAGPLEKYLDRRSLEEQVLIVDTEGGNRVALS